MRLAAKATGWFPRPSGLCPSLHSHCLGGCGLGSSFFILPHPLGSVNMNFWLLQPAWMGRWQREHESTQEKRNNLFEIFNNVYFFMTKAICVCGRHCKVVDSPFISQLPSLFCFPASSSHVTQIWPMRHQSVVESLGKLLFSWERHWSFWFPFLLWMHMWWLGSSGHVKAMKEKPWKFQTLVLALLSCRTTVVWSSVTCSQEQSYLHNVLYNVQCRKVRKYRTKEKRIEENITCNPTIQK